jgi:predicted porin
VHQVLPTLNLEEIQMQKKIIALAIAGLVSGAAWAQSNVTIYGVADTGYVYSSQGKAKFSGIHNNGLWSGNRLGFRGEEALGNGLKAVFTYEFGNIDIDRSGGINGTRETFVGLSGAFGTVTVGRQGSPSYKFFGATSSNGITTVQPTNLAFNSNMGFGAGTSAVGTIGTGGPGRWDNSIAYHSPSFSGLDFRAVYSFGENVRESFGQASSDASKFGIGVRYTNGPLYLTAIYETQFDDDGDIPYTNAGNDIDSIKSWAIGGNYDFKVVQLFANYAQGKQNQPAGADDIKRKLWSVGLAVPVSAAGKVRLEYMQYKAKDVDDGKAKGFGIGYDHDLSKRTKVYVIASKIKNDDGMNWGYGAVRDVAGLGANDDGFGENSTNFAVGISHSF